MAGSFVGQRMRRASSLAIHCRQVRSEITSAASTVQIEKPTRLDGEGGLADDDDIADAHRRAQLAIGAVVTVVTDPHPLGSGEHVE